MPNRVKIVFDHQYNGLLHAPNGTVRLGPEKGALAPYDLLLGGLGGCLNHTFQSIVDKQRLEIESVQYDIEGIKREEVPTMLKDVLVKVVVKGVPEGAEKKIESAFEKATRYCSVYQTLAHVADMNYELTLK